MEGVKRLKGVSGLRGFNGCKKLRRASRVQAAHSSESRHPPDPSPKRKTKNEARQWSLGFRVSGVGFGFGV